MKTDSYWWFVRCGIQQATWIVVALLLLVGIGWLGVTNSATGHWWSYLGWLVSAFAISLLSGPLPSILVCFDISDRQLYVFWAALVIPYWAVLGATFGHVSWKRRAVGTDAESACASGKKLRQVRWKIEVAALLLAVLGFPQGPVSGPAYISSPKQPRIAIINNLQQIDAAKQQMALEKKLSPDYAPTEVELAEYLRNATNSFRQPISHIRYVLNPIKEPPYAVLDSDWRFRRRGWRQGYTITNGTEFRLP
ncbi:MAG: hypothetical protein KIS67_06695 [Verrucomicrobiae bacterium]|nr:hypothetical protein [Verrucomicrobiae bacterium]